MRVNRTCSQRQKSPQLLVAGIDYRNICTPDIDLLPRQPKPVHHQFAPSSRERPCPEKSARQLSGPMVSSRRLRQIEGRLNLTSLNVENVVPTIWRGRPCYNALCQVGLPECLGAPHRECRLNQHLSASGFSHKIDPSVHLNHKRLP